MMAVGEGASAMRVSCGVGVSVGATVGVTRGTGTPRQAANREAIISTSSKRRMNRVSFRIFSPEKSIA